MTRNLSQANLEALIPQYVGKIAIHQTLFNVSRVQIVDARVDGDLFIVKYQPIFTKGLNFVTKPREISAHKSRLFATKTYLSAEYADYQKFFFDTTVIEKVISIVAKLPEEKTCADDYVIKPAPKGSRSAYIRERGVCTRELFSYLREQERTELYKEFLQ